MNLWQANCIFNHKVFFTKDTLRCLIPLRKVQVIAEEKSFYKTDDSNQWALTDISTAGHDGIPAQTRSTGLKYKPKDGNTMSSVYQSLNLKKSGHWIENKT